MLNPKRKGDEPATPLQLRKISCLLSTSRKRYGTYYPDRDNRTMTKNIAGRFIRAIEKQEDFSFDRKSKVEQPDVLDEFEKRIQVITKIDNKGEIL